MNARSFIVASVGLAALAAITLQPARAAFINIDDFSVPGQITVAAGDFENGITVNGQSTSGLGNSVTVSAADSTGPVTFSGSWINFGSSNNGSFAQVSSDDELVYTVSTTGIFGFISGEFCSAPAVCAVPGGATVTSVGEGPNNVAGDNGLSVVWQSASAPEPASLFVIGSALAGLSIIRRRRRSA